MRGTWAHCCIKFQYLFKQFGYFRAPQYAVTLLVWYHASNGSPPIFAAEVVSVSDADVFKRMEKQLFRSALCPWRFCPRHAVLVEWMTVRCASFSKLSAVLKLAVTGVFHDGKWRYSCLGRSARLPKEMWKCREQLDDDARGAWSDVFTEESFDIVWCMLWNVYWCAVYATLSLSNSIEIENPA